MKTKGRRLLHHLSSILMGVAAFGLLQIAAVAGSTDSLHSLNVGAAAILDADLTVEEKDGSEVASVSRNLKEETEKNKDREKDSEASEDL